MYASQVDEKKLNFQVSGMLWKRSLVMRDEETGSLWSHLLGRCMKGELEGKTLSTYPSVITDWETWHRLHPDTSVMIWPQPPGSRYRYDRDFYKKGDALNFVVGIVDRSRAKAYSFADLKTRPLINDQFGRYQLVLWYDDKSGAAWAYDRKVGDLVLEFQRQDGKIIDTKTRSQWDLLAGKATSGQLAGKKLTPLVVIPSFTKSWSTFHPNSEYWQP